MTGLAMFASSEVRQERRPGFSGGETIAVVKRNPPCLVRSSMWRYRNGLATKSWQLRVGSRKHSSLLAHMAHQQEQRVAKPEKLTS